ncbi:hypothetical protein HWV23_12775 [Natronomonas halophila]|uniref:DUF5305 family protein n=1 Tax=Natronomonas halophila TaxID=2747817 RepID=UPI0015B49F4A|nr:DUF5305 family protein [Natronomonas halophila]QLD86565.1 hypothetical protein HWV23_12775 [Natronomonas halophila]
MGLWGVRVRASLDEYFVVAVVALLVFGAMGGAAAYTAHLDPGTETRTQEVGAWESTAGYDHQATVTEANQVYPIGYPLENRSVYYTSIAPKLNGTFRYGFAGGGELDVEAETTLVLRSVGEEGETFWEVTDTLEETSTTIGPDGTATTTFSLNVSEVRARIQSIEEDLGASPGATQVRVVTNVTAAGAAGGADASHETGYVLSIDPGSDTYSVEGPRGETERHPHTGTVTVEREYGPLRSLGGPAVLVLSLLGLVALGIARDQEMLAVSEAERAALAAEAEREEFEEWISTGRVPETVRYRDAVAVDSLADLVDTAIDSDRRVVHDPADDTYHVIDDALRYEYSPDPPVDVSGESTDGSVGGPEDRTQSNDGVDAETDSQREDEPSSSEA